jgi:nucleotide-binding universal stress UspA family protein
MNAKKIVVGVNGSAASNAALDWAIQDAAPKGAEIIAVHASGRCAGRHLPPASLRFGYASSTTWELTCARA